MTFKTKSDSIYGIDYEAKMIRRVSGPNPPTNHFNPDGTWKPFKQASLVDVGFPVLIEWADGKYTQTNKVTEIL